MKKTRVHFMGVGGSGCSAAFALAYYSGFEVNGCDLEKSSPYLEKKLTKLVKKGHIKDHIRGMDLLVYSPAIPLLDSNNEELKAAKKHGLRTMPWEEFLAKYILPGKFLIAVSGTHGKGTTTAMIASILDKAGLDPSVLVGAKISSWGSNYKVGQSKYFVLEADEYMERFLVYRPDLTVITNVDYDHPDYYKDLASVKNAFSRFVKNLKPDSVLVTGPGVDLKNSNGETLQVEETEKLNLKMPGSYNKLNASLAAAAARSLGINDQHIKDALENFHGLARRFEFVGEEKGVLVFDDYAVHPVEIAETLKAAREKFPENNLWLVFQPHTFSRLEAFFSDFVSAFEESSINKIVFLDVFAAREKPISSVNSLRLAKSLKSKEVNYAASLSEAAEYVKGNVNSGDVVVCMGAGNIYKLPDILLRKLANKS